MNPSFYKSCFPFLISLAGFTSLAAQPPAPSGMRRGPAGYPEDLKPTHANVAYATVSPSQVLDVFTPEGEGPFPLLLNIHGGAFRMGSKEMLDSQVARQFLAAGIAVASVNYRLSGEAIFPAAVKDVKAAVRFLRANGAKFKLDGRIIAFGQSAGGNLASLLGTSGGEAFFEDEVLGNAKTSSAVQGVIDWFGPTDFLQMDAQAKAQGCPERAQTHGAADSPESQYLGGAIAEVPDRVRKANPITYISKDDPPFLLQKGTEDCIVPFAQSELLADALKSAGLKVSFDRIEGAGHGDMGSPVPRFSAAENIAKLLEFARRVFAL
jgi:acetyl esterase/lipase